MFYSGQQLKLPVPVSSKNNVSRVLPGYFHLEGEAFKRAIRAEPFRPFDGDHGRVRIQNIIEPDILKIQCPTTGTGPDETGEACRDIH